MDLSALRDLLPIMKSSGVTYFKTAEMEISFVGHVAQPTTATINAPSAWTPVTVPLAQFTNGSIPTGQAGQGAAAPGGTAQPGNQTLCTEKVQDVVLPQGLEEEMDPDKVLHWSSPGHFSNEGSVPLTDDLPLNPESASV